MFSILVRLFVTNWKDTENPDVRRAYGRICSILVIFLNILLVIAKLIVAHQSGSFSIRADAINNLTDVGSSVLLLIAFLFAGMKPRPDRPFGHGRIEYVAGFLVSVLILICGFETGKDAISNIMHPAEISFSWVTVGVLAGSIATKFYISCFSIGAAKKIDSEALKATGLDSLSDTISTFATLAGILIFAFSNGKYNLDGWLGLFVAILILKAGYESAKSMLMQLLGTKPSPELIEKINKICKGHPEVVGLHDLVVHDYGPGRLHISVHCEVPGDRNIFELHDVMDCIMQEIDKELGAESVVHMDPICVNNEHIMQMNAQLEAELAKLSPRLKIHDFRIVEGPTHTNVLFDCLVPLDFEYDEATTKQKINEIVKHLWNNAFPIVKIDRPYA